MTNVRQFQPKTRGKEPVSRDLFFDQRDAILGAIAELLTEERTYTDQRVTETDGAHLLLGSARKVAASNLAAVTKAIAPVTQRKAVVTEGTPPAWTQEVFK